MYSNKAAFDFSREDRASAKGVSYMNVNRYSLNFKYIYLLGLGLRSIKMELKFFDFE